MRSRPDAVRDGAKRAHRRLFARRHTRARRRALDNPDSSTYLVEGSPRHWDVTSRAAPTKRFQRAATEPIGYQKGTVFDAWQKKEAGQCLSLTELYAKLLFMSGRHARLSRFSLPLTRSDKLIGCCMTRASISNTEFDILLGARWSSSEVANSQSPLDSGRSILFGNSNSIEEPSCRDEPCTPRLLRQET